MFLTNYTFQNLKQISHAEAGDDTWEGVNTRNRVFFGWGRSWNTAIRFRF